MSVGVGCTVAVLAENVTNSVQAEIKAEFGNSTMIAIGKKCILQGPDTGESTIL